MAKKVGRTFALVEADVDDERCGCCCCQFHLCKALRKVDKRGSTAFHSAVGAGHAAVAKEVAVYRKFATACLKCASGDTLDRIVSAYLRLANKNPLA
eukprot:3448961-Amphidinium_carterae.2